jgi:putative addiction module component (TIGR02574 family)
MDYASVLTAASSLSIDDRIRLIDALSETIEAEQPDLELTDEFKKELDRRSAAYAASPEKALPWEVVKARALARLRR